jgi:putative transposase
MPTHYNPDLHHRRSYRLKDYDYAQGGCCFVTVCVQNRLCLFGEVIESRVRLNGAGELINRMWIALPERFPSVALDDWVIMPNHVHGLIVLEGGQRARADTRPAPTLGDVMSAYKSETTVAYGKGVKDLGWQPFEGKLWQRDYFDHIVRSEADLERIREYIAFNPGRWEEDRENPHNHRS